jgi:hypothetical protein
VSDVAGLYSWQWSWQAASERPEDAITNTFHFINNDTYTDFDNVRDMLLNFYTVEAPDAGVRIIDWMANNTITGNWTLKAYALEDPKPRQPVITYTGSEVPISTSGLPSEVALVLSFQAAQESGEIAARRRNRVYLGPFSSSANNTLGRPENDLVQTLLFTAKQLLLESIASVRWSWVAYSPTADLAYPITNGWVDNAWDTQRRRGLYYSARGSFTDATPV